MIPKLTYSINSIYDELLRYGWTLTTVQQAGTKEGMTLEYCFSGGGFDVTLAQVDSGRYFIRIYHRLETGGHKMIAISYSVTYSTWMRTLRIPTGDMIRLLYGNPFTFVLRLKQYELESVLEKL